MNTNFTPLINHNILCRISFFTLFMFSPLGLFAAVKRLAQNPLFIFITLNTILSTLGTFGHYIMLPKYMENQFKMSASEASLASGDYLGASLNNNNGKLERDYVLLKAIKDQGWRVLSTKTIAEY